MIKITDATNKNTPDKVNWKKPFFTVWIGQAFSILGSQFVQFALIWYLTRTTGSATVLAMATLVGMLPQIVFGPIAGALVDRWSRRKVMLIADSGIAVATIVLAVLFAANIIDVWHIYVLLFLRSLGGAFHFPAMTASTTLMVPEKQYSRIAGMNQTLIGLLGIAAPPLGALLVEVFPMQSILAIDVGTALLAVIPLLFIRIPQPNTPDMPESKTGKASIAVDMKAGFQFLISWPGMLMLSLIGLLINLLIRPGVSLIPLMVTNHFGGGALELAWLQSATGVGALLGGIALSAWGGFNRRIVTAMTALILDGIAITILGFVPTTAFILALSALFLAGLVEPFIHGSQLAIYQAAVPPEMQGRVFSLLIAAGTAMSPLGLALAGPLADRFGVQFWFAFGGILTIIMGVGAFFIPAILNIENIKVSER